MPYAILDLKGIMMRESCIEKFGKELTRYNIENGSTRTFVSLYSGIASALVKNFGNGYAFLSAKYAFKGAPKLLVEECSEKFRKLMPNASKRVIRNIIDLGIDIAIITHDIHSLLGGIYEELGFDLERNSDDLMDNDFSFENDRVSGIVHGKDNWPRVHDKACTLRDYMSKKGYRPEHGILVVHGPEEISMARMFKENTEKPYRIIVPKKGSCKELRDNAMDVYKDIERLPEMLETVFMKQGML